MTRGELNCPSVRECKHLVRYDAHNLRNRLHAKRFMVIGFVVSDVLFRSWSWQATPADAVVLSSAHLPSPPWTVCLVIVLSLVLQTPLLITPVPSSTLQ
jgi:hypothetical protein